MKTKQQTDKVNCFGYKGFTLLEVLISLAIISGGLMVIGQAWSGNFLRIRKANLYNNVSILLQKKMTEIEAKYKNKPLSEIPDNESGDFGSDFKQYTWTIKSQDLQFPDLSSVLVSREQGADETMLTIIQQMQEYISKSIKEVKLTVKVKTPIRSLEFSLTTYFVDYDQDFNAGI